MSDEDVRWIQRFSNFIKALAQLQQAIELAQQRPLTQLEEQGLIQAFEFTHELAWNTMKDFLEQQGVLNLYGSKDTTREAFKTGLIENGEAWMKMIKSRNLSSHTYDETTARQITADIRYKNGSDIDLTLIGAGNLTLHVVYKILDDIDELYLPYTIDLSIFRDIGDPDVVEHIQRVGVTFYEKGKSVSEIVTPQPSNG